jgi:hypothetical protein
MSELEVACATMKLISMDFQEGSLKIQISHNRSTSNIAVLLPFTRKSSASFDEKVILYLKRCITSSEFICVYSVYAFVFLFYY